MFNGYGELEAQTQSVNTTDMVSWSLIRDNNGRITAKTETVGGITSNYIYTYDAMGRLETVTKDGTLVEEYSYDAVPFGTCTYAMNALRGISGRNLEYNDEDQLLSAGSTSYQYNLDGFLTAKIDGADETYYTYSSRGELLNVTLPDGRHIEYIHDPLGRRIAKKVDSVIVEKYLWQGITRLLAIYDGSDSLLMRFEYAGGRMPVAMTSGGIKYNFGYDQVGTLKAVADDQGTVVKTVQYDSFGYILNDSDTSIVVPFGFAGGLHDRDTGLVRFGHRDYDLDVGRWIAKDPILFAGGDTDLYGYVLSDPVNLIDPLGLIVWGVMGNASGGVVGAIDGSVAVLSEGWFNDIAVSAEITGTIGPQITADLGAGILVAPFADSINDLGADAHSINIRVAIGIDIDIPMNNPKNFSISIDFIPGLDFGLGWGASWTWLFGEDEDDPCQ